MLETLRQHDPTEAARILSAVTSELLPNPEVGSQRNDFSIPPQLRADLWHEIGRRVKVDPFNASPERKARIFEFLFAEMTQVALSRFAIESVKARLSFRGELRTDLYGVEFQPFFRIAEAHGVRQNHVLEALSNPTDIEHVNTLDNEILLSFVLRTHLTLGSSEPFSLLVIAERKADKLQVANGMRIYHTDVDISAVSRPSDILRRLVGKYGFSLSIGTITSKLIIDETTTIEGRVDPDTIKVHAPTGTNIFGDVLMRRRKLHNRYGIALAFALDRDKYAADLRRHGVHVEEGDFHKPIMFRT